MGCHRTTRRAYLSLVSSAEPVALREMRADGGGADGVQQGRLLHMLVRLSRATRVLEVGSFSGYATLWMALALPKGGRLVSLERDQRAADVARRHLDASGVGERVDLVLGDAMETLPAAAQKEKYEVVVWRDAAAEPASASLLRNAASLVAPHGVLVLLHAAQSSEAGIEALVQVAREADPRWRLVTLPSPDGEGGVVSLVGLVAHEGTMV